MEPPLNLLYTTYKPEDLLRQRAVDERRGGGRKRHGGGREREAPRRRGVPDVLERRVVVERHAVEDVLVPERDVTRRADVDVVDGKRAALATEVLEMTAMTDSGEIGESSSVLRAALSACCVIAGSPFIE